MKIAIVVPGGVDRSGTHRVIPCLLWLIERLAAGGDEVHVFALYQEPKPGRWRLRGAEIHNAGARPPRLRALAQMLREHRKKRFDIVHAFWAAGPGVAASLFSRLTGVPVMLMLPGGDLSAIPDIGYGARLTWRGRAAAAFAIAGATQITVPSHWMHDKAAAAGIDAIRLPYGVALDRWPAASPRRRRAGSPLRLIHVASLNRVKDQTMLLKAMAALRDRGLDFRLDIIGSDTLGGAVQLEATALGLGDHVAFHDFLPHDQLRPRIEAADILVMSSRHETVPIVLLEAAVAGVPTVGTAVGQIADWAPDAAIAVPIGDNVALAEAILRLGSNEEERLRLAATAQRLAVAEDADAVVRATRSLYIRLLTKAG